MLRTPVTLPFIMGFFLLSPQGRECRTSRRKGPVAGCADAIRTTLAAAVALPLSAPFSPCGRGPNGVATIPDGYRGVSSRNDSCEANPSSRVTAPSSPLPQGEQNLPAQ